jgi:hypothetical protein
LAFGPALSFCATSLLPRSRYGVTLRIFGCLFATREPEKLARVSIRVVARAGMRAGWLSASLNASLFNVRHGQHFRAGRERPHGE